MYEKAQAIVKYIRTKMDGTETDEQLDVILMEALEHTGTRLDKETQDMVKKDGLLILTHLIDLSNEEMASEIAEIIERM